MKRTRSAGVLVLAASALMAASGTAGWQLYRLFGREPHPAPPRAGTEGEARVLATLAGMQQAGDVRFGVPEADGRLLRLITEAAGAKHVVEIGTSTGYSGLWLSLALRRTGGRLTTYEIDPGRAATAREFFRKAGLDGQATVVVGDAHQTLATLKDPIDVVFMDADKEGYVDYLRRLLPLLIPGGVILAHNIRQAPDYLQYVAANPDLETLLLVSSSGLTATLKKR